MTQLHRDLVLPQQHSGAFYTSLIDISQLKAGGVYRFHTKDWITPFDDYVPGKTLERFYLGTVERGGLSFIEVARSNGREHLIAVETLASWEVVSMPEKLRNPGDTDNGRKE